MQSHFRGFATHGHFKMVQKVWVWNHGCHALNSYIGWSMTAGDRVRSRRTKFSGHAFYTSWYNRCAVTLQYKKSTHWQATTQQTCEDGHYPIPLQGTIWVGCAVCLLEYRWRHEDIGIKGIFTNVGQCAKCGMVAHLVSWKDDREDGWRIFPSKNIRASWNRVR